MRRTNNNGCPILLFGQPLLCCPLDPKLTALKPAGISAGNKMQIQNDNQIFAKYFLKIPISLITFTFAAKAGAFFNT